MTLSAFCLTLLLLPSPAPREPLPVAVVDPVAIVDDVANVVAELKKNPEDADPALIQRLAGIGSREAATALVEAYDYVRTLYLRLAVIEGLAAFDGVSEAEQPCLQKLMDVATGSKDREARTAAIDAMAKYPSLGKNFLAMIVDSDADTEVRERALRRHAELGEESDAEFYERIFDTTSKAAKIRAKKNKKQSKRDGNKAVEARDLHFLRAVAFEAVASSLDDSVVIQVLEKDPFPRLRGLALAELERRDHKRLDALARDRLKDVEERSDNRAMAALVLARVHGKKEARSFVDWGQKEPSVAPVEFSRTLADILDEMRDTGSDKKLTKMVGKGKSYQKTFALWATRSLDDEKLLLAVRKQLADKDAEVRVAAALVLAERGDEGSLPAIMELFNAKEQHVVGAALESVSKLRANDPEWPGELRGYATSDKTQIRNAALMQLGRSGTSDDAQLLIGALSHTDWSTRLAALHALEELREKSAIPAIIEQMKSEKGRILHEFADVLFNLTGQPFRLAFGSWEQWWQREGANFEIISEADLKKRVEEEEVRRLKRVSNAKFFGIRIISHRTIFIIDVSGSMNEPTVSEGDALPRMDVARRELKKAVDSLDDEALFNIITFSSDVSPWLDDGVAGAEKKTRDEAQEYIDRLGAGGGTNIYGAIRTAFEDPDVDTIFFLSDGEPSVGAVTDPWRIREDVKLWNEHRKITINTIAVGGELQILEWLAEDSGGSHVKFW